MVARTGHLLVHHLTAGCAGSRASGERAGSGDGVARRQRGGVRAAAARVVGPAARRDARHDLPQPVDLARGVTRQLV